MGRRPVVSAQCASARTCATLRDRRSGARRACRLRHKPSPRKSRKWFSFEHCTHMKLQKNGPSYGLASRGRSQFVPKTSTSRAAKLRGLKPAVAGDQHAALPDEDRHGPAELAQRCPDLLDLLGAMDPRIARVHCDPLDRPEFALCGGPGFCRCGARIHRFCGLFGLSKPNQTEVFDFAKTRVFRAAAPSLARTPQEGPVVDPALPQALTTVALSCARPPKPACLGRAFSAPCVALRQHGNRRAWRQRS